MNPPVLHLLKSEPDDLVAELIDALSGEEGAVVVCLYRDEVSGTPVDWDRLVDDIFRYERIICWW